MFNLRFILIITSLMILLTGCQTIKDCHIFRRIGRIGGACLGAGDDDFFDVAGEAIAHCV